MSEAPPTPAELKAEHEYRYAERCAISGCYTSPVPGRVHSRAYDEADEAIATLSGLALDEIKRRFDESGFNQMTENERKV